MPDNDGCMDCNFLIENRVNLNLQAFDRVLTHSNSLPPLDIRLVFVCDQMGINLYIFGPESVSGLDPERVDRHLYTVPIYFFVWTIQVVSQSHVNKRNTQNRLFQAAFNVRSAHIFQVSNRLANLLLSCVKSFLQMTSRPLPIQSCLIFNIRINKKIYVERKALCPYQPKLLLLRRKTTRKPILASFKCLSRHLLVRKSI